jgi:hypothetical protein
VFFTQSERPSFISVHKKCEIVVLYRLVSNIRFLDSAREDKQFWKIWHLRSSRRCRWWCSSGFLRHVDSWVDTNVLALKIEAVCFPETSVSTYESTRCHNPEAHHQFWTKFNLISFTSWISIASVGSNCCSLALELRSNLKGLYSLCNFGFWGRAASNVENYPTFRQTMQLSSHSSWRWQL